jgi:hypothetical protein
LFHCWIWSPTNQYQIDTAMIVIFQYRDEKVKRKVTEKTSTLYVTLPTRQIG